MLVHLAGFAQMMGFLIRDQLKMRLLLLTGSCFYILYYLFANLMPLWNQIFWASILAVANLTIIFRILIERTTFRMRPAEIELYAAFRSMSPGEFRRLLRVCSWKTAPSNTLLIEAGKPNKRLYHVMDGHATVCKANAEEKISLPKGSFVGELSFLLGAPATATVSVPAGTRYVYWNHSDLTAIERRYPSMRIAIREILNIDLAGKVAGENLHEFPHAN